LYEITAQDDQRADLTSSGGNKLEHLKRRRGLKSTPSMVSVLPEQPPPSPIVQQKEKPAVKPVIAEIKKEKNMVLSY
jgi:hypothetical protein